MEDYTAKQLEETLSDLTYALRKLDIEYLNRRLTNIANVMQNNTAEMETFTNNNGLITICNTLKSVREQYIQIKIAYKQKLLTEEDVIESYVMLQTNLVEAYNLPCSDNRYKEQIVTLNEKIDKVCNALRNKEEDFHF